MNETENSQNLRWFGETEEKRKNLENLKRPKNFGKSKKLENLNKSKNSE